QIERHERLSEWRKLQGIAEGVPSNVIMPKELLDSLTSHPANSLGELKQLMNLTPTRFERYGRQILTILKEENQ
ncbi:MAG TPA: HRDC domain-containing protein, partial [Anaerolineaceae bacterium]|nr:HRDC domain-containing protein [Anaerolineaceae bacterium]